MNNEQLCFCGWVKKHNSIQWCVIYTQIQMQRGEDRNMAAGVLHWNGKRREQTECWGDESRKQKPKTQEKRASAANWTLSECGCSAWYRYNVMEKQREEKTTGGVLEKLWLIADCTHYNYKRELVIHSIYCCQNKDNNNNNLFVWWRQNHPNI